MTKRDFDAAVDQLLVRFAGSVTSGRRTLKHTLVVGGFKGDPHTWGFGVDVVWDHGLQTASIPDDLWRMAQTLRIKILRERTHDHLQPMDFPSGPVTCYDGLTQ